MDRVVKATEGKLMESFSEQELIELNALLNRID